MRAESNNQQPLDNSNMIAIVLCLSSSPFSYSSFGSIVTHKKRTGIRESTFASQESAHTLHKANDE